MPQIPAPSLEGLAVEIEAAAPPSADDLVYRLHEVLRSEAPRQELRPGQRLQLGDEVDCDIIATVNGRLVPSAMQRISAMELRPLPAMPGLIEQFVGMASYSSKIVKLTMLAECPDADLAGQEATFFLTTRRACRVAMPELDDPSALSRAGLGETLEEAMATIGEGLVAEQGDELLREATEAVLDVLAERVLTELPVEAVAKELESAWSAGPAAALAGKPFAASLVDQARQEFLNSPAARFQACRDIKVSLALAAIIREENLEPASDLLETLLDATALATGQEAEEVEAAIVADPETGRRMMETAFRLTAVEYVLARAKVNVVERTVDS